MHWPFGRRTKPGAGRAAPDPASGAVPAGGRPHDAWRSLPAVQRTIGRPPVVAPAAPFAGRLATRRAPDLALQPLGHEVSPLAAAGLLIGITAPGDGLNAGRVELPVQRLVPDRQVAAGEGPGWSSFDDGGQGPATLAATLAAVLEAAPERAGETRPNSVGIQRLATSAMPLTTAAPTGVAPAPAGILDLRPSTVPATEAAGPPAPGAPFVQTDPAPVAAVAETEAPVRRPTLGQARRLGLGAPLLPGSPVLQRLTASEPGSIEHAGLLASRTEAARTPGQQAAGLDPNPGTSGPSPTAADAPPASNEAGGLPGPTLEVVRPLSIERRDPRLPLELATGEDWPAGIGRSAPPALLPLAVQRDAGPGPEDDRSTPSAGVPNEVELATSPNGPGSGPAIRPAAPVRLASIRASSGSSLLDRPLAHRPDGPGRARGAPDAGSTTGGPVVARSIGGLLPAFGQPSSASASQAGGGPAEPLVPRGASAVDPTVVEAVGRPGPALAVPVQRAVEVRELSFPARGDGSGGAGSASPTGEAAPGAPPVSAADRDRELDDLARRLYGRIRSKLAAELLADRERAGVLVDLR